MQVAIRHPAVPDFNTAPLRTDTQHSGAAEHVDRQDAFELGIHFAEHFAQPIPLGRHAVKHFRQRHRPDRSRQAVPGKVGQQQVGIAGRGVGRQQQITIEQGIGRLQITDIRRAQTARMRHPVKNRLGHPLLVEQVIVVPGNHVALLQDGLLQAPHPVHHGDFRRQQQGVVRLAQHIVAARLQTAGQGIGLIQGSEKNDRHQHLAGQRLDLPGCFETVHHGHQTIHQHQLWTLEGKQRYGFSAIGGEQHVMPLTLHNARQQQAVSGAVFGNQHCQGSVHVISNSLSKLEMLKILSTSGLLLMTRISELSPPA